MLPIKLELPDGFLDEEVRCGYTVTSQMKKVWAVELDLLNELLRVCKKHSIRIFASGGTMLGAVRHKGFIPWDDDIDMMMLREDYQRLCEIAESEFRHPYFFQTEYTDPGSLRGHAQLRNSMTTGILLSERPYKLGFNQGIFIDIFPLDAVVENDELFEKQYIQAEKYKKWMWRLKRLSYNEDPKQHHNVKNIIIKFISPIVRPIIRRMHIREKVYAMFEKTCQKYNDQNTKMISSLTLQFNNKQHFKFREDYESAIWSPFEFCTIPISCNYDHALRQRFGDYQQLVRGGSLHGEVLFDTECEYKVYLKQK